MTLNARQEAFVREYLLDGNGTRAAIAAGYSARTAASQAADLLNLPKIATMIAAEHQRLKIAAQFSVEATHDEIRALAHSDPRSVLYPDGRPKPPGEWTDEAARTVAGFEITEKWEKGEDPEVDPPTFVKITKIKFWPKDNVLTLKAKVQKLVTDRVEHTLDKGTADALMKARERRNAASSDEPEA